VGHDRDEQLRGQKDEAGMTKAIAGMDGGTAAEPKGERLQKILAAAGVASRRKAEEIILAGRVQVNGKVVMELGTKHDASRDHIRVDGKLLKGPEVRRYYMLNKPRGYVTTLDDPQKRPTVMDLMMKPKAGPHGDRVRLYPVGRLDYLSEGLLLMTNDGELANALSKAAAGVEKTYLVKVSGVPEAAVNVPLNVQPANVLVAQPPLRSRPCTPTGEESRNVVWRLLRWSKLERPRSRFRLSMNCTTVPPGPLKLDASSMDLERV